MAVFRGRKIQSTFHSPLYKYLIIATEISNDYLKLPLSLREKALIVATGKSLKERRRRGD
jgi:hypothetical protein